MAAGTNITEAEHPIAAHRRTRTEPDDWHVAQVRQYYDVNSSAFARFGQGAGTGTIRRAVWGPQVRSQRQAFEYVDRLILKEIESVARASAEPAIVLDLGCGVGGSLCFLAQQLSIAGVGITISGSQAVTARARARELGVAERVAFRHADFIQPLADQPRAQLAFSVEAFVHAPSPKSYFAAAARLLAPGGTLIICDDVRSTRPEQSGSEARWLQHVREGWLARSLTTAAQMSAAAERAGFMACEARDLSGYLQLGRSRDHLLRALLPLLELLPFEPQRCASWRGGDALQRCLSAGLIEYRYMTWRLRK